MKIILTGATGFLGSHLTRRFLADGHEIIVLKRSASSTRRLSGLLPQLRCVDVDIDGVEAAFSAGFRPDAVIHAATCYGRNGESASQLVEANVQFPLRLFEAAIKVGTRLFLNTDTFFNTGNMSYPHLGGYSLGKRQFVEWGRRLAGEHQCAFSNLKVFHVYGPEDDPGKFVGQIIGDCLSGKSEIKLTSGEQKRDFIYIDDVVEAFHAVLFRHRKGGGIEEFEVGRGEARSIREFVEKVHEITRSPGRLQFGELPRRANEFQVSQADARSLLDLGWRPKWTLEAGLEKTIEAWRQAGKP